MNGIKRMNKKGGVDDVMQFIPYFTVIAFLLLVAFIGYSTFIYASNENIAYVPDSFELEMISQRFFLSQDCFAADDKGGWTIDLEKFSDSVMQSCYTASSLDEFAFGVYIPSMDLSVRSVEYYSIADYSFDYVVRVFDSSGKSSLEKVVVQVQS